ncbi:MAG TPA: thioesterase family protein [Gaiellaceae bacterium]|jgi:acyl-CoA thioester hydrolase
MEGFRFSTDVRVRFSETDAQGVVHNAVYLDWLEISRIAYLARFRGGYRGLRDEDGVDATTVESWIRYVAPAVFDDVVRVYARVSEVRGARFRFDYEIERVSDPPGPLATAWTTHATVDSQSLRPTRMPAWLADAIRDAET